MREDGPQQPSDDALIRDAKAGKVRALEHLLDRHQGLVSRVLRLLGVPPQDREDVTQDVFIRVFRHLDGFRDGRPFRAWLYRVSVNAAHDHRGRHGRRAAGEAPLPDAWDVADPTADASVGARERELRRALWIAMGELSERERAVFVLRELEGMETAEVAGALGVSAITVRRHLGLARRRLRRLLRLEEKRKGSAVERAVEDGGSYQ